MFEIFVVESILIEKKREMTRNLRNRKLRENKGIVKIHKGHSAEIYIMNKLGRLLSYYGRSLQDHFQYENFQKVS